MKRNRIFGLLTVLALVMIVSQSAASSMAYFTTYVTAKGGRTISYESVKPGVEEEYENYVKSIQARNDGNMDCYARVKVLAGAEFGISYESDSGKWSQGDDGYWYYSDILPAGALSDVLKASIQVPEELEQSFDVVVAVEATPVRYQEDGTPYADWSRTFEKEAAAE